MYTYISINIDGCFLYDELYIYCMKYAWVYYKYNVYTLKIS